jgi:Ala-tRNA(Pro) deacylase
MPILAKLREFLDRNKVAYSAHSHPEAFTAQEIAALQHVKGRQLVKVVMAKTRQGFVMLALPADRRVDFAKLGGLVGDRDVRLAAEAEFRDLFPECQVGAMPPFGNLYGLSTYLDRSLEGEAEIVFNAGTHTLTAKMALRDYLTLVKPVVADFSVHL